AITQTAADGNNIPSLTECGCPFTIKTPDDKAQGQTTGGDVTPCHIVMRALALSDLRGQGQ
ncbi:hypothetical protein ACLBPK_28380, partial [Klebsiella pneumoniae]|uniref:hypothetical protein n=1 Tax=Klebsiella pneumoniae TaxID=573 RepID=UPI0039691955